MRHVICTKPGLLSDLSIVDSEPAPCGEHQVRVQVRACGVNFVDALFVQGRYQIKPPPPFTPGSEIAGVVTEIGSAVEAVEVGDRVTASIGLGGFSSEIVVHPSQLLAIPENLTFEQAATFGQSYATAWYTLTRRTTVAAGEWVVALGAAGGVGMAILDVASHLRCNTIAAASSDERLDACAWTNPKVSINYSDADLKVALRSATENGADVVVDPVGGDLTEQALRGLGDRGRLMIIGFATGQIPNIPTNQILLRNRMVIGVDWGIWALTNPTENAALLREVLSLIAENRLRPPAPHTYTLDHAAEALDDLGGHRTVGKVALIP